jgi:hypothetical protein
VAKATVTLEDQELQQLEAILMDGDREAALEYLRLLKRKVDLQARHLCKPSF